MQYQKRNRTIANHEEEDKNRKTGVPENPQKSCRSCSKLQGKVYKIPETDCSRYRTGIPQKQKSTYMDKITFAVQ